MGAMGGMGQMGGMAGGMSGGSQQQQVPSFGAAPAQNNNQFGGFQQSAPQ